MVLNSRGSEIKLKDLTYIAVLVKKKKTCNGRLCWLCERHTMMFVFISQSRSEYFGTELLSNKPYSIKQTIVGRTWLWYLSLVTFRLKILVGGE